MTGSPRNAAYAQSSHNPFIQPDYWIFIIQAARKLLARPEPEMQSFGSIYFRLKSTPANHNTGRLQLALFDNLQPSGPTHLENRLSHWRLWNGIEHSCLWYLPGEITLVGTVKASISDQGDVEVSLTQAQTNMDGRRQRLTFGLAVKVHASPELKLASLEAEWLE